MRKRGYGSLIWGGLLVILGLALLIDNLDVLGDWNAPVWSLVLGTFSLVFLATYILDREQWWALIPGLVILGIAVAVFLAEQDLVAGYIVATIILAGVGLPFLLIYLSDRQHGWALIPAMTMTGIAAGVFLEGLGAISGPAVGGLAVAGVSLGFVSIYLIDREQWWALIPGGVMGVLAFFLLLATATRFVLPVAIIVLGLLLLRSSLGSGRHREVRAPRSTRPIPTIDTAELDRAVKVAGSKRERLPTLEEQIEAAIAEPPADMPPTPEMPQPPEVPPGPEIE